MRRGASVKDVEERIRRMISNPREREYLLQRVSDLPDLAVKKLYRDVDNNVSRKIPLEVKVDVTLPTKVEWTHHGKYRAELRDQNPRVLNKAVESVLKEETRRLLQDALSKHVRDVPREDVKKDWPTPDGRDMHLRNTIGYPAKGLIITLKRSSEMDKQAKVARELVKLARDIASAELEDKPEDIAYDVWSRMVEKRMDAQQAFKSIGYGDLYKHTREVDMPDDFDPNDKKKAVKALTKAIEKAAKRMKKAAGPDEWKRYLVPLDKVEKRMKDLEGEAFRNAKRWVLKAIEAIQTQINQLEYETDKISNYTHPNVSRDIRHLDLEIPEAEEKKALALSGKWHMTIEGLKKYKRQLEDFAKGMK